MTTDDIIIFGGAALFVLAIYVIVGDDGSNKKMQQRIERAKNAVQKNSDKENKKVTLRRHKKEHSLPFLGKGENSFMNKLQNRLEMANLEITAEKYLLIPVVIIAITTFVISAIFSKPLTLAILVGLVIGLYAPYFYLNMKIEKQKKEFLKLFPDAIDLIVRGLRAGLPVAKSMQTVSQEIPDPVKSIFQEMVDQIALGVTFEKALSQIAKRLDLTEFNFFVTSIILQRETGGNLGEILSNLSNVLRQRQMMKLKIKALSSEAKASAMIVGALPFLVFGILNVVSPDYISLLYTDYRGNLAALGALGSMGLGAVIMARMTNFEI